MHDEVYGLKNHQVLADSKITFNYHMDLAGREAGNVRLFESTGMGCCLLTDWKENITDYFIPDQEVVTYKNIEEAIEKVKFLIDHEDVRVSIATNGQKKAMSKYTLRHRVLEMDNYIKLFLAQKTI